MTAAVQWISVIFGMLALVQTGWALRCWECSSHTNVMCGDPMNTSDHQATFRSTECQLSPYQSPKPICRKLVKREYGERIVVRSCSIPNIEEVDVVDGPCGPIHSSSPQTVIESCHICSTDLCNSAPSTSTPQQLLYATVLALVAYRFAATKFTAL